MRSHSPPLFAFSCLCILLLSSRTHAVITANTPLKQVVDSSPMIFVAKVKEVLPDKPAMVLQQDENLKGEAAFGRMPVNLTGDGEAAKGKHTQVMLDRIDKDVPIVVIVASKKGKKTVAFGYTEGTWFQMEGRSEVQDGNTVVRWSFLHGEPYLRRTFKGTTAELRQIIVDSVKNMKEPPAPNEKEEPGFGPPIKKSQLEREVRFLASQHSDPSGESDNGQPHGVGILIGVIQLPFIGLIAALAALFPTVFGGLALLMRRWMVILSIASLGSIIYTLYMQFPNLIRWTGIETTPALWIVCAALAAAGALWSAQRYRQAIVKGRSEEWQPRKLDRIALCVLILVGAGTLAFACWVENDSVLSSPWSAVVIALAAMGAGAFFIFSNYLRARTLEPRPPLAISAETVMLWAGVFTCSCLAALEAGRSNAQHGGATRGDAEVVSIGLSRSPALANEAQPLWVFKPKESGEILSTPCITPDHLVVSVFHSEGLSQYGRVYGLDPANGKEVWRFPNDLDPQNEEEMKPVFCSPVFADGRIYVGEGFHKDDQCRMLCLDAATGRKLWEFKTKSHTESTPAVADGMVVFGAGNDGLYVLNAATGEEIWHYTGEKGFHMDSNPAIADGLIYGSSGYSRTHREVNRIFCLDPKEKKEVWGERVEQSAYGSPAVFAGQVFFTTGNSTFSEHRDPARGYVYCRDAKSGTPVWDAAMPDTVICRPALDREHVYISCWDGFCYALDRKSGAQKWKNELDGEGVASPFLDRCSQCQASEVLYVASKRGAVKAYSPQTGKFFWNLDLRHIHPDLKSFTIDGSPVVVRDVKGPVVRRRIYIPAGAAPDANAAHVARLYCYEDVNDHSKP